jgi:ceramide glucosyltransferase
LNVAIGVVSIVLLAASVAGALYLLIAMLLVRRFVALPLASLNASPPVTILKPLCGDEHELYENLRSFVEQSYPDVQIIFGVREERDPAIGVAKRLIADLPDRDLALVVDPRLYGSNFKISNVINMMAVAKHNVLVVADSDMRVTPDYLSHIVGHLQQPGVGLVTCLYKGAPVGNVWSRLGAMFINHGFLPGALVGAITGKRQDCFGATMALTRETLAKIGGFEALKDHLADDHALGALVCQAGLKIALSPEIVGNVNDEQGLKPLVRHELRWALTTRLIEPLAFAASIITYPMLLALAALPFALVSHALTAIATGVFLFATACRIANVKGIDRALKLTPTALWLIPVRDLLSCGTLIASYCVKTVEWRGQAFKVQSDGHLSLESISHDENFIPAPPIV